MGEKRESMARALLRKARAIMAVSDVRTSARLSSRTRSSRDLKTTRKTARPVHPRARGGRYSKPSQALESEAAETTSSKTTGIGGFVGFHHIGVICENLEKSVEFYRNVLGLPTDPSRPHDNLPFDGHWFSLGTETIHLMELPNPDPSDISDRPEHGGRDRHLCVAVESVADLEVTLKKNNVKYTKSKSGRPAIFFRDPDANTWECLETQPWR